MKWFIKCLKKYADFSGRTSRTEYWRFVSFVVIFMFVLFVLAVPTENDPNPNPIFAILLAVFSFALIIPSLAFAVRRLHDIGKSGWYILIGIIPIVGSIIQLVWACTDSEHRTNEWGQDPSK